jgi:hypothetical protein
VWSFSTLGVSADLAGWWRFEEGGGSDANDSSGNGNDGALQGDTHWTAGKIGDYALAFDGNGDYVDVPGSGSLDFTGSFSVSAWVKPTASPSADMSWFGYHHGGISRSIVLRVYVSGKIRFGFYYSDLDTADGAMSFGVWNHVVATYDFDTDTSKIYVDGEPSASGNVGPYLGGTQTMKIGMYRVGEEQYFDGDIDDVRVYNKALSEGEVGYLYLLGSP